MKNLTVVLIFIAISQWSFANDTYSEAIELGSSPVLAARIAKAVASEKLNFNVYKQAIAHSAGDQVAAFSLAMVHDEETIKPYLRARKLGTSVALSTRIANRAKDGLLDIRVYERALAVSDNSYIDAFDLTYEHDLESIEFYIKARELGTSITLSKRIARKAKYGALDIEVFEKELKSPHSQGYLDAFDRALNQAEQQALVENSEQSETRW